MAFSFPNVRRADIANAAEENNPNTAEPLPVIMA
jgi:hypothetical protein